MKILFMIPKLSYTGAPKIMVWVANQMYKFGHNVQIVTMYKSKIEQRVENNIKIIELNVLQDKSWLYRNTIGMFKVIKKYRNEVKKFNPDVIVSFLDSVSYFYIFLNHFFWHTKILISERADPYHRYGWKSKFRFFISKFADYAVFQTEQARDFFKNDYKINSTVIGNPVFVNDNMKKAIQIRKNIDNFESKKIVNVSRLNIGQKRQDILIKAFAEFVKKDLDYNLYIYGGGPDEDKIKELIKNNNLTDKVFLMGQQDNILEKIADAECFVLTSDFEGIPNALIEAMSIGLPCISTDCSPGGARLLIHDNINGFIVNREDYVEIANKMDLIVNNKKLARKLGKKAIEIADEFSEQKIAKKWEKAISITANRNKDKR